MAARWPDKQAANSDWGPPGPGPGDVQGKPITGAHAISTATCGPLCTGSGYLTYQHRLQEPFEACKPPGRTNLLNYNYCFCRCFQLMKVEQFSMFFPLINIKSPLLAPGTTWGLGRALGVGRRITHDITEVACDFL